MNEKSLADRVASLVSLALSPPSMCGMGGGSKLEEVAIDKWQERVQDEARALHREALGVDPKAIRLIELVQDMTGGAWLPLSQIRRGAVFETRSGVRAVKTEYRYPNGGIQCVLLASGEYAHFAQEVNDPNEQARQHNRTEVREIVV